MSAHTREEGEYARLSSEVCAGECMSGWGAMDFSPFIHPVYPFTPSIHPSSPPHSSSRRKVNPNTTMAGDGSGEWEERME